MKAIMRALLSRKYGSAETMHRIGAFARNGANALHLYVLLDLYRTNGNAQRFGHRFSMLDADYRVEIRGSIRDKLTRDAPGTISRNSSTRFSNSGLVREANPGRISTGAGEIGHNATTQRVSHSSRDNRNIARNMLERRALRVCPM